MMKQLTALLLVVILLTCTACSAPVKATETVPATAPTETETASTESVAESRPEIDASELPYDYETPDGLLRITLPNHSWGQLYTDQHAVVFSDGSSTIAVDLYKATDSLPLIPTADKNHKLIFTSAVSAESYVLYLIGYAREETDFPNLAAAISSITVDKERVTKVWPEEESPDNKYSIRDTNYTAWVSANALNVRTGSGTENAVICQLTRDTKLTVTGEVLNGKDYIGWSRVRLSNGTVGYVSSRFLTTSNPAPQSANATKPTTPAKPTKTGSSAVLYSSHGTVYKVYLYSDDNWRTDSGTVFWPATFSTWESATGQVLYDYDPSEPESTQPQLTSQHVLLYSADGSMTQNVYLSTDGEWYNSSWVSFSPVGNGVWYCGGTVFYDYDPSAASTTSSSSTPRATDSAETIPPNEPAPEPEPPANVPPADVPPADVPPADVPPVDVPPADVPPADVPPADVPPAE